VPKKNASESGHSRTLAEIEGLLVQMMAIEKLALGGLPKEGRELLWLRKRQRPA
jgi:hypothetical protein